MKATHVADPYMAHAARVAVVATVIIGAMYVFVVVSFDVVDRHRLVAQIDTRLDQRLDQATRQPSVAGSTNDYDNAHDVEMHRCSCGSSRGLVMPAR